MVNLISLFNNFPETFFVNDKPLIKEFLRVGGGVFLFNKLLYVRIPTLILDVFINFYLSLSEYQTADFSQIVLLPEFEPEQFAFKRKINNWELRCFSGWCIFRPTQIHYTPLLTNAKSAILHNRYTSTWFYSCWWTCSRSAKPPCLS